MTLDEGTTHYVGDGCQPAHDPAIDQPPPEVTFDELHAEYLREIASKLHVEAEVERYSKSAEAMLKVITEDLPRVMAERDELRKENERLQATLEWVVGRTEETPRSADYGRQMLDEIRTHVQAAITSAKAN